MRRVIPADDADTGVPAPTYPVPAGPNVHPEKVDWDKIASDIFDSLDYWNDTDAKNI